MLPSLTKSLSPVERIAGLKKAEEESAPLQKIISSRMLSRHSYALKEGGGGSKRENL